MKSPRKTQGFVLDFLLEKSNVLLIIVTKITFLIFFGDFLPFKKNLKFSLKCKRVNLKTRFNYFSTV